MICAILFATSAIPALGMQQQLSRPLSTEHIFNQWANGNYDAHGQYRIQFTEDLIYEPLTQLHIAALTGKVDAVYALMKAGADINAHGKYNYTPLHFAACEGNEQVNEALVDAGADIYAKNIDGHTPLDLAKIHEKKAAITVLKKAQREASKAYIISKIIPFLLYNGL